MEKERRAQILAALEQVVLREGLARLTLAKVADEAGLPRPLVRYFAGNRDDLILMLLDRMVARGEAMLDGWPRPGSGGLDCEKMLELILDGLMADETLGLLAEELWSYAALDEQIHARLGGLYRRICDELAACMAAEGLGRDTEDRQQRAYAVVSLAYGAACFADIGFVPPGADPVRQAARLLLFQQPPAQPDRT
jgi:AcrR family transcriptional regulator